MDQSALSSRAIMGMYYARLEANPGLAWVNAVANLFDSDQESETYNWLGMPPAFREWIGGRQAKGFRDNGITLINKHYESTIEFRIRDMRRDKTGQIMARIEDFADRALTHWASLLSTLILNGAATACYDGQFYFDTDHSEGSSGTQDNDITVDISAVPAEVHGTTAAPSAGELQWAIMKGITQIVAFVDDQGEPLNDQAMSFLVMVPPSLYIPAVAAVSTLRTMAMVQNVNPSMLANLDVEVTMNTRLSSWTDKFVVFRTDSPIKGLIRQQETEVDLKVKDETSEYAFDTDNVQFGLDTWREVGYGLWQRACLVTMI